MARRKSLPMPLRMAVLHEAGYRCSNPTCRTILTLDIHHLKNVSEGGADTHENLLALCPNCHSLHHKKHIPQESLRAWKMLLLALNESFDRRSIDMLLALDKLEGIMLWGDGVLNCAALVASGMVSVEEKHEEIEVEGLFFGPHKAHQVQKYWLCLSAKGRHFVEAWKRGDQNAAVKAGGVSNLSVERDAAKARRPSP